MTWSPIDLLLSRFGKPACFVAKELKDMPTQMRTPNPTQPNPTQPPLSFIITPPRLWVKCLGRRHNYNTGLGNKSKTSLKTCCLSGERLMTQLDIMTSTEPMHMCRQQVHLFHLWVIYICVCVCVCVCVLSPFCNTCRGRLLPAKTKIECACAGDTIGDGKVLNFSKSKGHIGLFQSLDILGSEGKNRAGLPQRSTQSRDARKHRCRVTSRARVSISGVISTPITFPFSPTFTRKVDLFCSS